MTKYKIIPNQNKHPDSITYDFMMNYFTVESDSPINAFRKYYERNGFAVSLDLFGYVFDTESLDLYYVSWSVDEQIGYSSFAKKLEKPKMKTYRLIPNQKNLNPSYEEMMSSEYLIEACTPKQALLIHRAFNPKVNCGMALDIGTLDLYRVLYSTSFLDGESYSDCFVRKLKPEPKMNKYKYKIIPNRYNSIPSYDEIMESDVLIDATGPKTALSRYRHLFDNRVEVGWTLNLESLDLHKVIFDGQREYFAHFFKKLEKPEVKMNTYKILITPKTPTLEVMLESGTLVEAESAQDVYNKYYSNYSKFNTFRILNLSNLELTSFTYNQHKNCISFCVEKLEKPMTKPKPMNNLSFKTLAEANLRRLPLFKNSKGLPAHSKPDGSDWSRAEWLQAVIGELGEYANIMKKVQRGDLTMEEAMPSIEKELADVMTYFAILAQQLNIDLGQAVEDKFNEVSDRVKANVYISNDKVVSNYEVKSKKELRDELIGIKEKAKKNHLTAKTYHKPMSFDSNQLTTMLVGAVAGYLMSPAYYYIVNSENAYSLYKPQMKIQLQDLGNGKGYSKTKECAKRMFPMPSANHLKEMGSEIVEGTLTKILLNGKEYETNHVIKVGDMIQFSDERNVLYSLRVTECSVR